MIESNTISCLNSDMEDDLLRAKYERLFSLMEQYFDEESMSLSIKALRIAEKALDGMTRYDGTPLMEHSVKTAEIVIAEIGLGRNSTIATLLHDVERMGLVSGDEIAEQFGNTPRTIIEGMSRISSVKTKVSQNQAENFRDLIVSYSTESDPRVILIKLADRLEVMRALDIFPEEKRIKKSWESMNIYAQIAHKLGLYSIKGEFEDLALKYLEPTEYNEIKDKLARTASERDKFIKEFLQPIEEKMKQSGFDYHIKSRTKSIYSIWRKMKKQNVPFEEVFDIFAIRVILDCELSKEKMFCWAVYSIVTDFYTPNPDRMRDWISIPKSSGYESLHTTVVTKSGRWVEIQIRTERMDEVAERGIAAHWRYKGVNQGGTGSSAWLANLRELMEENQGKESLSKKLNPNVTNEEIFVFTPTGDLRKMREGATVLDFAFDIHTNVGASCIGAQIKGRIVPIKEKLRNGDIVKIITAKNQKPKSDWLNIVTSTKARNKIKQCLREEQTKLARLGREELERKIKNWKLAITIDDAVVVLVKYYKTKGGMDMYGRIATEKIDIGEIKDVITRHLNNELFEAQQPAKPQAAISEPAKKQEQENDALIIDEKIRGIDYKFAKCCNPIMGDKIFGFTTINSGITIHRTDCPNAKRLRELYPYRVIDAKWREQAQGKFIASIRVVAEDSPGMVNRITEAISEDLKINIRSMNISPLREGRIGGTINIEVPSSAMAEAAVFTILRIKGVDKAHRITNN